MPAEFPPRRHHERYDCRIPVHAKAPGNSKPIDGEITNISMGGACLRLRGSADAGSTLQLDVEFEGERLQLKVLVVRIGGKDAKNPGTEVCGITFQTDPKTLDRARAMVDRIRAKQRSGPNMKTPDYWKI